MARRAAFVGFVLLGLAAGPAHAQGSLWLLGRPALHVALPADPTSGGVPWSNRSLGLPTSWSSEASGLRVEVAELSAAPTEADVLKEIDRVQPGMGNVQRLSVSGYPAWEGS